MKLFSFSQSLLLRVKSFLGCKGCEGVDYNWGHMQCQALIPISCVPGKWFTCYTISWPKSSLYLSSLLAFSVGFLLFTMNQEPFFHVTFSHTKSQYVSSLLQTSQRCLWLDLRALPSDAQILLLPPSMSSLAVPWEPDGMQGKNPGQFFIIWSCVSF